MTNATCVFSCRYCFNGSPQERSTKADEYAEEIRGGLPSDEGPRVT